jgi:glutaredoxin
MRAPDELRVYWQPGCTSCLRTKEFLAARGVPFTSINVLEDADAAAELRTLGVRAVPVVARAGRYVLGQDLGEVARFVGVAFEHQRLEPAVLAARLARLLGVARALALAIPPARIHDSIPARPRRYADIAFHVGMIVQGLLDAADTARAGELTFEHFERLPAPGADTPAALADWLALCRAQLDEWSGRTFAPAPAPESGAAAARLLRTYYGERPLHEVLERSAWHVAQHVRQLDFIVASVLCVAAAPRLCPEDLDGLPVPRDVWDPEIRFA